MEVMDWKRKMFVFPENGRLLHALINKDKVYLSYCNFNRLLGYNSKYRYVPLHLDRKQIIRASEPAKLFTGVHDAVHIIEAEYAMSILEDNEFCKPIARVTAPKLLTFIRDTVLPECSSKTAKPNRSSVKMSEISNMLKTGINFFNNAAKLLSELELEAGNL